MLRLKRRGWLSLAWVLGLLAVLAVGCGPSGLDTETGEMRLGVQDDGSRVELQAGQVLVISLDSNPTTGYLWELGSGAAPVLRQLGESEFLPSSGLTGAGGTQVMRFEAASAGQANLELVYHRPWQKLAGPLQTFSVQVVVP